MNPVRKATIKAMSMDRFLREVRVEEVEGVILDGWCRRDAILMTCGS
jgi:hypothetical protein